jgi:hypothetical protein
MENTDLIENKNKILIFGLACILLTAQSFSVIYASQPQFPNDFKVSEYFSFFGSGGIDWQALHDPNNNPILVACIRGITYESLKSFGIPDVQQRLERLERGNLVKNVDGRYLLAFPAIVGDKRDKLREYAKQAAQQMVPSAEKMIAQIRTNLAGHDEMIYHVLWSVVMDGGPAWDTARDEMNKKIDVGDTSIENKAWLIYPSHPFQAGTNSANNSFGHLRVTWSHNTPNPNAISRVIWQHASQLAQAIEQDRAVESADAKNALSKYGLLDESGKVRLYTIKADSEAAKSYAELGAEFGRQMMIQLDAKKVAQMLDVSPGVAFVIAYHEISWQLLQDLSEKKVLKVPQIVAQAGTKTSDAYQLVSLTIIQSLKNPLPETEKSTEEAKAIEEYRRIKKQILAGESYKDTSTPLHAVLTHLSSLEQGQIRDYFMGFDILRAPLPPAKPQEASLWPVYAGETELADTFILVYSKGRWIWIGNMGSNYDWNTAKSTFEKWAREKIEQESSTEEDHPESKKTELIQTENEIAAYFEKTKNEILQGRKFSSQSTPADALLTLISAYHHQDKNTLEQIFPIVRQKQFERLSSPEVGAQMLAAVRKAIICRIEIENEPPKESDLCAIYSSQSPDKTIDQVWSFAYVEGAWRFAGSTSETDNWRTQAKQAEAMTRNILQSQAENTKATATNTPQQKANKIEGKWNTTLPEFNQSYVIRFWRKPDGTLASAGTRNSPDDRPFNEVTFENGKLRFEEKVNQGVFEGTMKEDGLTIEGKWQKPGMITPCVLNRIDEVQIEDKGQGESRVAQEAPTPNEPTVTRVLSLDGQDDCIRVADSQSLHSFSNAITIEVWLKASSFYGDDQAISSIIRKNVASGAENFLLRLRNINGSLCAQMGLGEIGTLSKPYEFDVNKWYHLAGTYDGSTITAFVNGQAIASQKASGQLHIDQSDLYIGKGDPEYLYGESFHGQLDEIRIWNIARSQEQIQAAMNTTLTGKEDGLVAYWNFDDGTTKDLSGHGNNGVLGGGARIVEANRPTSVVAQQGQQNKLVAWWKFENDANDSAGSNNGTIHGNPTFVDGKFGRAICFDGNDYIDCGNPDSLNFGTGDWTISAWFKTTQTGTNEDDEHKNRGTIFANGGDQAGGIRYALIINETSIGRIDLVTDDDKTKIQATSGTVVNDGNWHHVVGMRNAGQLRLYVDGALDGGSYLSDGYDLSDTSQHNAYIGVITDHRDNSLCKYFNGLIDEVCIFAGAIDANGVRGLYSGEDPLTIAKTAIIPRLAQAQLPMRQGMNAGDQKGIEGNWEMIVTELGRSFNINISQTPGGNLAATSMGIPLDRVTFNNGEFHFEGGSPLCIFDGTLKEDGLTIEGKLRQKDQEWPALLKRIVAAAPSEVVPVAQQQLQNVTPGAGNIAVALILVLALAGVVGAIVFFLVKSSIR